MKTYKSHKTVQAAKILGVSHLHDGANLTLEGGDEFVTTLWLGKHGPDGPVAGSSLLIGGYFVRCPDGYTSWSPAQAFEEGYSEVLVVGEAVFDVDPAGGETSNGAQGVFADDPEANDEWRAEREREEARRVLEFERNTRATALAVASQLPAGSANTVGQLLADAKAIEGFLRGDTSSG